MHLGSGVLGRNQLLRLNISMHNYAYKCMDFDPTVNISDIQANSISAGPGERTEVFFFGCSRDCPGCINKWVLGYPYHKVLVSETFEEILRMENPKVTICGGEPLEQKEALVVLLDLLSSYTDDVILYTGYNVYEILRMKIESLKCRFVIAGPFQAELAYMKTETSCVGSMNQVVFSPNDMRIIPVDNFGRIQYIE